MEKLTETIIKTIKFLCDLQACTHSYNRHLYKENQLNKTFVRKICLLCSVLSSTQFCIFCVDSTKQLNNKLVRIIHFILDDRSC